MADIIVFDKDGTLLDFDAFWISVSANAIRDILQQLDREDIPAEEILASLGVKNNTVDIDGILCHGTYEQMGLVIHNTLTKYDCNISPEDTIQMVINSYIRNADTGEIKPTCENIVKILSRLKKCGKTLLVVTTDTYEMTQKCLTVLGIEKFFDRIYTDDGKTPAKPNPQCILDFCKDTGVTTDKIIMVGDTMTDIHFARNAGISVIGVGKTEKNRQLLHPYADWVLPDISHIFEVLSQEEK